MQQAWQVANYDGLGAGRGGDDGQDPFPYKKRFEGPWMQQQLLLSISIGVFSFLIFSLIRRRSPALFAPRTKLKGFAPHAKGIDDGVFSWIRPTLRTEEIKILHIVGLDAAILLSFFKMGFWTFAFLSLWTCGVLMPVNYHDHGTIDGVAPSEEPQDPKEPGKKSSITVMLLEQLLPTGPNMPWTWRLPSTSLYHFTHLLSTYIFTALILRALYKGFNKFVRSRQLYALDLLHSIPARTVEVRNLPQHLQGERDLAEYFEAMGFAVESTVVVREVQGLKDMLVRRARALYQLETTWCKWLGNPTTADYYDPDKVYELCQERAAAMADGGERMVLASHGGVVSARGEEDERSRLLGTSEDLADPAAGIVAPKNRRRPTMRIQRWNPFSRRVDAITLLEARYRVLDATVQKMRSKGSPPSTTGFVTFIDAMSAQVVAQSVHYPIPAFCKTSLAPEPRDIIWSNVSIPTNERRLRQLFVTAFTIALFIFYIPPLAFLASLLLPSTIKKYLPTLYKLLEKNERLMAFASTNLPSVVLIGFNALLPLVLEWTAYLQGLKARSLVEFNVLKRYHLFLLISVIFIFLITRTALGVLADLANNPMRIIDKLAQSLPQARHFSLSYVIFQSMAVIPLQLLQLPVTLGRAFGRLTARTPREHAELNAPPQLYAGSVYPAALIVYTLCVVYSVVSPLITVFGAIYFALAYLVYKYKVLYVFYRSYESRGQAWPLSSMRCLWALVLFQFFQLSLFSFRKQLLLSTLMLPLIIFTLWFGHFLSRSFNELSEFVSLSSIAEINKPAVPPGTDQLAATATDEGTPKQRSAALPFATSSAHVANSAAASNAEGMTSDQRRKIDAMEQRNPIVAMRTEALVDIDPSQTVLSRKRYSAKDDTLFVAQKDRHTDYREPPAAGYFYGTLNTGRRRYGHPALTGILPDIWPPVRVEDFEEKMEGENGIEEGAGSIAADPNSASTADAQVDGSENGSLIGTGSVTGGGGSSSGGGGRLRRLSRPKESVVVSLRRRKSSLLGSAIRSSPSSRFRTNTQGSMDAASSGGVPASAAATGGSSMAFPQQRRPSESEDEDNCDMPGHQHEDSARAWGSPAVAPARQRLAATAEHGEDDADEDAAARDAVRRDGRRRIDTIIVAGRGQDDGSQNNGENEEEEEDDDDDDDETDELKGVYIHRAARNTLPGSFPGFRY